mgnify:CR=1 FL=1
MIVDRGVAADAVVAGAGEEHELPIGRTQGPLRPARQPRGEVRMLLQKKDGGSMVGHVAQDGEGKFTFTLDEDWGKLPEGMSYGLGCALVVDSQDRIFVTSRSTSPCVAIFDKEGKLVMDATARTYRYLDDEEIAKQRKAKEAAKAPK